MAEPPGQALMRSSGFSKGTKYWRSSSPDDEITVPFSPAKLAFVLNQKKRQQQQQQKRTTNKTKGRNIQTFCFRKQLPVCDLETSKRSNNCRAFCSGKVQAIDAELWRDEQAVEKWKMNCLNAYFVARGCLFFLSLSLTLWRILPSLSVWYLFWEKVLSSILRGIRRCLCWNFKEESYIGPDWKAIVIFQWHFVNSSLFLHISRAEV